MASLSNIEINFLERAIALSEQGMKNGDGGPFGCVIVKNNIIIAEGNNKVICSNDPTAHAEIVAIRSACEKLSSYQLEGCDVYTSCEPCPMCLGAIYWARPERVIYANTRKEAAAIEFDDDFIYSEIRLPAEARRIPFLHYPHEKAAAIFSFWKNWEGKTRY